MGTKGNTKNTSEKQSKATTSKTTQKSSKAQTAGSSKSQKKEKVVEPVVEPVVETKKKTGGSRQKKEKVVEPEPVVDNEEQDEKAIKAGLRYFKLDFEGEVGGRYSGKKPKQAANKAYSSIVKKKGMEGGGPKIQFSIKECTRGSRQKTYTYDGQRIELDNPVVVNIKKGDKKTITYKFSNKLSKAKNVAE
jgi:hypothetical protein